MKREKQKELRRNEIIEKSLDLFIANGYAATKISDIAKAVNMSVGLMFHYFDSKEALYECLVDFGIMGTKSVMQTEVTDCLVFFETVADTVLSLHKTNMFAVKMFVLMGQAQHNQALPDRIKEKLSQIDAMKISAQIIEKGQSEGKIRNGNPLALSVCFWSAIQGIMETLAIYPDMPTPQSEWIVDLIKKNYRMKDEVD